MKQNKVKCLEEEKFRKLTRIKPEIFEKMLEILSDADQKKQDKSKGATAYYFRIHTRI